MILGEKAREAFNIDKEDPKIAETYGKRAAFPNLDAWVKRLHARPAYKKALEKGGPYRFDK